MSYPTATIETSKGNITVELWDDVAPKHAENFQKLANDSQFQINILVQKPWTFYPAAYSAKVLKSSF